MAKLTIDLDTEEQTVSVQVNGQTIDKVSGVNLYNYGYGDENPLFVFEVTTVEKIDGVSKYTRLTASEKDGKPSEKYAGLFDAPVLTKAQQDIIKMLDKGRKL